MEGRKQRNFGRLENLPKEQKKYDLGSWEQRGHITTGAGSMGPPLQSLRGRNAFNKVIKFGLNCRYFPHFLIFLPITSHCQ